MDPLPRPPPHRAYPLHPCKTQKQKEKRKKEEIFFCLKTGSFLILNTHFPGAPFSPKTKTDCVCFSPYPPPPPHHPTRHLPTQLTTAKDKINMSEFPPPLSLCAGRNQAAKPEMTRKMATSDEEEVKLHLRSLSSPCLLTLCIYSVHTLFFAQRLLINHSA